MPDNVLRVGTEFDVGPLIAGTQAAAASFEQMKTKLQAFATQAEATNRPLESQAARFLAQGLTVKEATSALINLGLTEKEATTAVLAAASAVGIDTEFKKINKKSTDEASDSNIRFGSSMAIARVEAGALMGSTGMVVGGLAKVAAQSAVLGPLLQLAFPVFAVIAFAEILGSAIKKLKEWEDQAQKSADAQAAFERELLKTNEALDQSKEKMAGMASAAARLQEELAHGGEKVLDLTETTKKLNERLEDGRSYWKDVTKYAGDAFTSFTEFTGITSKQEREMALFNRQIADTVKQSKDLPSAISAINSELEKAKAAPLPEGPKYLHPSEQEEKMVERFKEIQQKEKDRKIALLQETITSLKALQESYDVNKATTQAELDQKMLEQSEKVVRARISFEEAVTKESLKRHITSLEEEKDALLKFSEESRKADEAIITSKLKLLSVQESKGVISKEAADVGRKELFEEAATIEINAKKRAFDITTSINEQILTQTLRNQEAEINAAYTISEAQIRVEEDRARRAFNTADTITEVETTSQELIRRTTAAYDEQIKKLSERAGALAGSAPEAGMKITATIGTDEFAKQLEQIKEKAPEIYRQMLEINSQIIKLTKERADATEKVELEASEKTKKIRVDLAESETKIEEDKTKQQLEKQIFLHEQQQKLASSGIFAETSSRKLIEAKEAYDEQASSVARIITLEEELRQKLIQIGVSQQDPKFLESLQRQQQAVQQLNLAWQKYQQTVTQVAVKQQEAFKHSFDTVTNDFNRSFTSWMNHQETFGHAMEKMWENMAATAVQSLLKIVEQEVLSLLVHQRLAEIQKLSDAKAAARGAFRSVMQSPIPPPLNFILASTLAAAAFAAVMAFQQGGIVPGREGAGDTVPALLAPQEMVLPTNISKPLMGAVPAISNFNTFMKESGRVGDVVRESGRASTTTNNIKPTINFHQHGSQVDLSSIHDQVVNVVRTAVRRGSLVK